MAEVFIGLVIIAITEVLRRAIPKVSGWVTIIVAGIVGGIIGAVDVLIGLDDITIAAGILIGLSASGAVTLAKEVKTNTVTRVN